MSTQTTAHSAAGPNRTVIRPAVGRTLALTVAGLPVALLLGLISAVKGHGATQIAVPVTMVICLIGLAVFLIRTRFHVRLIVEGTSVRYVGVLRNRTMSLNGMGVLHARVSLPRTGPTSYWCLMRPDGWTDGVGGIVHLKLSPQLWDSAELDRVFCNELGLAKYDEANIPASTEQFPGLVNPMLKHYGRSVLIGTLLVLTISVAIAVIVVVAEGNHQPQANLGTPAQQAQAYQAILHAAEQQNGN